MTSTEALIAQISAGLESANAGPVPLRLLQELREIAAGLAPGERSAAFHNTWRGFVRCWGDEFSPGEADVGHLVTEIFERHGYPDSRFEPR